MDSYGMLYDKYVLCRVRFGLVKGHMIFWKYGYTRFKKIYFFLSIRRCLQTPLTQSDIKITNPYWIKTTYRLKHGIISVYLARILNTFSWIWYLLLNLSNIHKWVYQQSKPSLVLWPDTIGENKCILHWTVWEKMYLSQTLLI